MPAFNNPFHSYCSILAIINSFHGVVTQCICFIFILVLLLALKLHELLSRGDEQGKHPSSCQMKMWLSLGDFNLSQMYSGPLMFITPLVICLSIFKKLCPSNFLDGLFFPHHIYFHKFISTNSPLCWKILQMLKFQFLVRPRKSFPNLPKLYFLQILLWTFSRIQCCTFAICLFS